MSRRILGMIIACALLAAMAAGRAPGSPGRTEVARSGVIELTQARHAPSATPGTVAEKIRELGAGDPVKVAGAAYWLGEEGVKAKPAITQLASVLGDNRPVDPAQYRKITAGHADTTTPGQEAATALVKIGDPAIEALIHVLKTSPNPVARQNAAWALGLIQDRHALSAASRQSPLASCQRGDWEAMVDDKVDRGRRAENTERRTANDRA